MFASRRIPAVTSALLLAAIGAGCGEDVLVSSWELELRVADAGTDELETDVPSVPTAHDGGLLPHGSAMAAQKARAAARRKDEKERSNGDNGSGDSGHQ